MELHPILEAGDEPNPNMWYVLSARGEPPSMRVGHTCMFIPAHNKVVSKLLVVGGANPSGSFAETYFMDFARYEWDVPAWIGLQARYEHTAWVDDNTLYVFGGAMMSGNLNTVQRLELSSNKWLTPATKGTSPSPRTCHSHASDNGVTYIFGGGETGAEPVADRQVHVFDSKTLTWTQPKTNGKPPKARHGHVMVVIGNKLYVHGGMSRNLFFDDLHEIQLKTMTWKQVRCKGEIPSGRAAHSGVAYGTHIIISCGMNHNGALDDLYSFNTETSRWTMLNPEGPPPACRLDHSMCIIEWKCKEKNNANSEHSITNQVKSESDQSELKIHELTLNEGEQKEQLNNQIMDGNTVEHVDDCGRTATSSAQNLTSAADDVTIKITSTISEVASPSSINNTRNSTIEGAVGGDDIISDIKTCTMLLMHGGMDTQGEIFDDTLVMQINLPPG